MKRWRQTIARWLPVVEYLLAGNLRTLCILMAVLVLSWYALTEFLWQLLLDSRHDELDYAFLVCPFITIVVRARRVRRAIDAARGSTTRPLPMNILMFPPAMLAAMCDRLVAAHATDAAVRDFFHWMGRMMRKTDPRPLGLNELPKAWRRRGTYWASLGFRTSIPLLFAVFLASPWQFHLGHALARALDNLMGASDFVAGGEICQFSTDGKCVPLEKKNWAGDVVSLQGDAADAGRIRIRLRNWPRSGRYVHFKSQSLYVVDPNHSGIDLKLPVRGRFLELPYFAIDTNVWALWAEIEYFPFRGEKFVTATYSGTRVPQVIPPARYRSETQGNAEQSTAMQGR